MSLTLTEPAGLVGCRPRFATPRNPERATLGGNVAEIARRLGTPLMPWQRQVADVALELHGDGSFVYDEVDILVPRQSGKTTLIMAKTLHRLVVMARSHGPQRSTYVAQKRLAARNKFERDFAPALRRSRSSFPEVDHARMRPTGETQWRLSLNNGSEAFEFGTGSWWQIGVPDDSSGHGDTLDDGTIDEARFQETAEVEEGLRPSQATRRDAQLWVVSTAGTGGGHGTVNSVYLWRKVLAGRAAAAGSAHGRVAYFEWSAPDEADDVRAWGDPEVWRLCMPALGVTIPLGFVESEWEKALREGQDKLDNFRRAYLNQWPEIPSLVDETAGWAFDSAAWGACEDQGSTPLDPVSFALDVAVDRRSAAFAAAALAATGGTHLEVVDYRPGVEWVVERAALLQERNGGALWVAEKSPASSLVPELVEAGVAVTLVSTEDHAKACAGLFDGVEQRRVRHLGDSHLNTAVRGAQQRSYGDAWLWSRRNSKVDICPLVAVTLAAWAVGQAEPKESDFFLI